MKKILTYYIILTISLLGALLVLCLKLDGVLSVLLCILIGVLNLISYWMVNKFENEVRSKELGKDY